MNPKRVVHLQEHIEELRRFIAAIEGQREELQSRLRSTGAYARADWTEQVAVSANVLSVLQRALALANAELEAELGNPISD